MSQTTLTRRATNENTVLRAAPDANNIVGAAFIYNVRSALLYGIYYEELLPGCADSANMEDVVCRKNHDNNLVLGRTPETLKLELRSDGLYYDCDVAPTTTGKDVLIEVDRGDLRGSSFGYTTTVNGIKWGETDDGIPLRQVANMGRIVDVAPVTNPAFIETSVNLKQYERQLEQENRHAAPLLVSALLSKKVVAGDVVPYLRNIATESGVEFRQIMKMATGQPVAFEKSEALNLSQKLELGADVTLRALCADNCLVENGKTQAEKLALVKTFEALIKGYK
jgi:HK97 family phage prohead protease